MTIPERFKNERIKAGYTQEQVARKLNTSRSNVANWENGQNMPRFDLILKCSELYGCDVMYLTGHQDERIVKEDNIPLPEPDLDDYFSLKSISKNKRAVIELMEKMSEDKIKILLSVAENMVDNKGDKNN